MPKLGPRPAYSPDTLYVEWGCPACGWVKEQWKISRKRGSLPAQNPDERCRKCGTVLHMEAPLEKVRD